VYRCRRGSTAAAPPGFGPYVGPLITLLRVSVPQVGWYLVMIRLACLGRVRFRCNTAEKTQALFSKKNVNKQQGWVEGRTFVRLVHLVSVSGAELLKVRLDFVHMIPTNDENFFFWNISAGVLVLPLYQFRIPSIR
jgi:hypothetical protein